MASTEVLQRRIRATQDLGSVVRTMKALAAASARHYEDAVAALDAYAANVNLALQSAARHMPEDVHAATAPEGKRRRPLREGAIIVGSDQGMCGSFNDQIVAFALEQTLPGARLWAIGERLAGALWAADAEPDVVMPAAGSLEGITSKVSEVLDGLEPWRGRHGLDRITVYHNRPSGGVGFAPVAEGFWPVDLSLLDRLRRAPWPGPTLPLITASWEELVAAVVRQKLFVTIYKSLAQSMASENSSRLTTMERAEKNIDERLTALEAEYNYLRQQSITAELLDIVAGFEALTK